MTWKAACQRSLSLAPARGPQPTPGATQPTTKLRFRSVAAVALAGCPTRGASSQPVSSTSKTHSSEPRLGDSS